MKTLFLDAFSGASGNMILGLLLDLGANRQKIFKEIEKLNIGEYEIIDQCVDKCGISCTYFDVKCEEFDGLINKFKRVTRQTTHFRNLNDIREIIVGSDLTSHVKDKSIEVFTALAAAEAKVHGKSIEDVHFHEVGAVDTIIDIVGSIIALEDLGIENVIMEKVCTGRGFVKCAHGIMPIPAPATAELLKNLPNYTGDIEKELLTPTGAALLSVLVNQISVMPNEFICSKIGYGAGKIDLSIPNVLRGYLGEMQKQINTVPTESSLYVLETNIDDMNPQFYELVMSKLFDIGAVDVWLTPIIMKKNRPAHTLSVLLNSDLLDSVASCIMQETTSIGVRYYPVERRIAERRLQKIELFDNEQITVKYSYLNGELVNVMPEYEDCKRISNSSGKSLKYVWQQAMDRVNILKDQ